MQETGTDGSRNMKFPLKVTNVTQDTSGASGRTARIIGTNVTLAHGAPGSANSIETATAPAPTQQAANSTNPVFTVPTQPTTQVSSQPPTSKQNSPPSALQSFLETKQKLDRELKEDLQKFSVYDPSLGAASFYGFRF